jgi:hypothetical protein
MTVRQWTELAISTLLFAVVTGLGLRHPVEERRSPRSPR